MEGVYSLMNVLVSQTKKVKGKVNILSSKSELHRLILISAFADEKTEISFNGKPSKDVLATISCIRSIGANVKIEEGKIIVTPISEITDDVADVFCNESGSTLRFILPMFTAIGKNISVTVSGRLGDRPLSPMYEILESNGATLSGNGKYPLVASGRFLGGSVEIAGNVSSQFISGLLMAMPLTKNGGSVKVIGAFESRPYVDITIGMMEKFGVTVTEKDNLFTVSGKYKSPKKVMAGGDWSNTAFFACLGAISKKTVITGLDFNSLQGDKKVAKILAEFGAKVKEKGNALTVKKNKLQAVEIDAKDIPDMVPALSIVASVSKGKTVFKNAERLRLKESDRIKSVVNMINSLGGEAEETPNGLIVIGKEKLKGGTVDGANDHRIVMSASIASAVCENQVIIEGSEAVEKSYPQFFEIIKTIGFNVEEK